MTLREKMCIPWRCTGVGDKCLTDEKDCAKYGRIYAGGEMVFVGESVGKAIWSYNWTPFPWYHVSVQGVIRAVWMQVRQCFCFVLVRWDETAEFELMV